MKLVLKRLSRGIKRQFGVLYLNGKQICVTIERPWKNNKPFESCIPAGTYKCRKVYTDKVDTGGIEYTYMVENVSGRDGILFHVANYVHDVVGCIGVGVKFDRFDNEPVVKDSTIAFFHFIDAVGFKNEFDLEIIWLDTKDKTTPIMPKKTRIGSEKINKKLEQVPDVEHEPKVDLPFYRQPGFKRGTGVFLGIIGLIVKPFSDAIGEVMIYTGGAIGGIGVVTAGKKSSPTHNGDTGLLEAFKGLFTQLINFLKLLINLRSK